MDFQICLFQMGGKEEMAMLSHSLNVIYLIPEICELLRGNWWVWDLISLHS